MRTVTIPIDLDTARALLAPEPVLIELTANGPGVALTIGAARLIEEAAKTDPPPEPGTRGQGGNEEGRARGGRERNAAHMPLRSQLQERPGQGHPPDPHPRTRRRRRRASTPTNTHRPVRHRTATCPRHGDRAGRAHPALLDV